ncbi:replication initiation protein [Hymenobacter sp. BT186]|uniref:Replication initiation protein n=1 Tax=Hymenobacter telluris TaxID=2816474 RepID=A0A939F158_9BACT|nr:replication initiation protein [Hymenobacter telluris]MBO0360841.1 replication initiation protein [Hymenobacter telluris]MBW3376870.1 replication initiation protein [Hymenobacter norwichensis]
MIPDPTADETSLLALQNKALLNDGYSFLPLHIRLFVFLLAQIDYDNLERNQFFVPTALLLPGQSEDIVHGDSSARALDQMCRDVIGIKLHVETFRDVRGQRRRKVKPVVTYMNLISVAAFDGGLGGVLVKFTKDIMPYLLQLHQGGNYPLADLDELLRLGPTDAQPLFELLQEFGHFSHPKIDLDQLARLLKRAQPKQHTKLQQTLEEVQPTALPFVYEQYQEKQLSERFRVMFPDKTSRKKVLFLEDYMS